VLHEPPLEAVTVAWTALPSRTDTLVPGSAVPASTTVDVFWTALLDGVVNVGVVGATVSTVTVRVADGCDVPLELDAVAEYVWLPSEAPATVAVHRPEMLVVAVARTVEPSRTEIWVPGSAVPEKAIDELRLQLASDGETIAGAAGAAASPTVTSRAAENGETLRARSMARAV
jgi:hypothetical protein